MRSTSSRGLEELGEGLAMPDSAYAFLFENQPVGLMRSTSCRTLEELREGLAVSDSGAER